MEKVKVTQYETLIMPFTQLNDDGTPLPLPELIESDITDQSYNPVMRLDVKRIDEAGGKFLLTTDNVLAPGKYIVNIFFSTGGVRTASPKFVLLVEQSPTIPQAVIHA